MAPKDETTAFARVFGQAVREAREKLGLSQEELGFESKLDRTYISGIERGVRNPTIKTILRICRALGARPSSLLRTTENRTGWAD